MTKKITSLSIIIFITATVNLVAQTVLQTNNLPVVGDLWSNKQITDTSIQPGPAGMNQSWNFSNYIVNPTVISEVYSAPSGTGNDALYPTSNLKVSSFFGGFDYYIKSANELQYLGSKSNSNEIVISNIQKLMTVPFSYGDTIANQPVTGTGLSNYPLSGTISVKADGTGDLILFTGAFSNTLRVTTDINIVQGAGTGLDTYFRIQRFTWYSSFYRAPIFQISILDVDGALGTYHQKYTTVSTLTTDVQETNLKNLSFSIVPNPSHGKTTVSFLQRRASEISFKVYDLTGRQWKEEVAFKDAGQQSVKLDLSLLPKGVYILSINDGIQNRQQRLVID